MNAGHLTVDRSTWWIERGLLLLATVLAAALYVVAVTKAELGLPLDVQLALFESQHGILWVDGHAVPDVLSLQAVPARQHR
ncbi:MAG TPA: hypothetical protein VKY24_26305 [Reyranella sp.]|nr:hypothetical protein [Reyranella sp.]